MMKTHKKMFRPSKLHLSHYLPNNQDLHKISPMRDHLKAKPKNLSVTIFFLPNLRYSLSLYPNLRIDLRLRRTFLLLPFPYLKAILLPSATPQLIGVHKK
jgi:hypothetical protein